MDNKTGIFYTKNPSGVVVMQNDIEIARYCSVQDFVLAHKEGIEAVNRLDESLHKAIESQYKPSNI
ncbi:MAG: hypothetical protein ABGY96_30075 [bacterium]|nr:hypothetical protein [Gammaproteobacteria bacterium]HIL97638.1 hypothetical protein [Pseudomonadales bacterium]